MVVNAAAVGDSCGCAAVPGNTVDVAAKRTSVGKSVARRQTPAHIITQTVECPVLVMHGTDDDIVPIESGMAIQEACRKAVEPLWLEGYGHNDLPNEICLRRVREFMDQMDGLSWGWNIFVTNLATHISVNL
ncbi:Abhd17a [Symbiodinium pilosum]|uniref:Abhd17a protein n=1 Tax=Symbiodinium pilosum TaxID=2952 RepID=A0A812S945_SYMPI|nr:Abhd17a [Symbiodinium pilosum]